MKTNYAVRLIWSIFLMGIFIAKSSGQTSIYSTNFDNSGSWPTGWSASGGTTLYTINTTSASSGYTGASGNYNADNGTSGTATLLFSNSLSTVGYTSITVLWGGRKTASGVSPTFYWSPDGSTWTAVTFTDVGATSTWALVNGGTQIPLPSGAAGIASLHFKWVSGSAAGTYRMDDFSVSGTAQSGGGGSGWQTLGNAGTVDGTNFIGTTDNIPLTFRVNNIQAARIAGRNIGNTFLGYGVGALSTGTNNTFIGYGVGALTTGTNNTANGYDALTSNTTGSNNIAIGDGALANNIGGSGNTSLGYFAGYNSTGSNNVFLGNQAGQTHGTGSNQLWIDNGDNTVPLIYGDFSGRKVGIGTITPTQNLDVKGGIRVFGRSAGGTIFNSDNTGSDVSYQLPSTQGAAATILSNDGSGNLGWTPLPTNLFSWTINGNSGTISGVNFIGTTDNVPLTFRVNNQLAGRIDYSSSIANTFFGYQAGINTAEANNAAYGYKALNANITGYDNIANGPYALYYNTSGSGNTASGPYALTQNETGFYNTANGYQALMNNTSGNNNTAIGMNSLADLDITDGSDGNNTALGFGAGTSIVTGANNTFIGANTGFGVITGTNNTIIGANVIGLSPTLSSNIIIADGSGNRRINVNGSGNVGIGTTSPGATLDIKGSSGSTLKIEDGNQQNDYVLTSDATGNASWQPLGGNDRLAAPAPAWLTTGNSGTTPPTNFIGTADANDFVFNTGGSTSAYERMRITYTGYVGIGTTSPTNRLHVVAPHGIPVGEFDELECESRFCVLDYSVFSVNQFDNAGNFILSRFSVNHSGNVGIGTNSPQATLEVDNNSANILSAFEINNSLATNTPAGTQFKVTNMGTVYATEVIVTASGIAPDYVFDSSYKLKTIKELENYVKLNKHLPNIPSAKEIKENKLALGEMNMKLLEKVEELTLYVMDLQKQVDELKKTK